jgi:Cu+-exporting ATPase
LEEFPGNGIKATYEGKQIKIGSASFVSAVHTGKYNGSVIFISINNCIKGYFILKATYKNNLEKLITNLKSNPYQLAVLSGDNNSEEKRLAAMFGSAKQMYFNQQPQDKLDRILSFKLAGKNVLMLGDGLNDAGALAASNVGIAVSQNINNFYPACDAIIEGNELSKLNQFLKVAKSSTKIIFVSLAISIVYNVVGLSFALQGNLSPVVAAILMPISSISIVVFTSIATRISVYKNGLKN